jgi:hypothetical protein
MDRNRRCLFLLVSQQQQQQQPKKKKILNLLAAEGPGTSTPSKFIRYIYNRVSLETAPVRAAAITGTRRPSFCRCRNCA